MENLLPLLFVALAALALILMLYFLWRSLHDVFVHGNDPGVQRMILSGQRTTLLAEKQALLVALKDLEAERATGKLSNEDWTDLNARYRGRAREVLAALDAELGPYRETARALIAQAAAGAGAGATTVAAIATANAPTPSAPTPSSDAPVADTAAADGCTRCGTGNDADAVFCKKCGSRMRPESGS